MPQSVLYLKHGMGGNIHVKICSNLCSDTLCWSKLITVNPAGQIRLSGLHRLQFRAGCLEWLLLCIIYMYAAKVCGQWAQEDYSIATSWSRFHSIPHNYTRPISDNNAHTAVSEWCAAGADWTVMLGLTAKHTQAA